MPGIHDWFYIDRVGLMIETGVLTVVEKGRRPVDDVVRLTSEPSA